MSEPKSKYPKFSDALAFSDDHESFSNALYDRFAKKMNRIYLSRIRNIRRAWKLRGAYRFYKKQYGYCVDAVMWMHDDHLLKHDIPLGHSLTITGPVILKKQRDNALSEVERLKSLLTEAKPKRVVLTELPCAGEVDENVYLTLHDHYMQTKKLRDKIKQLEKNK